MKVLNLLALSLVIQCSLGPGLSYLAPAAKAAGAASAADAASAINAARAAGANSAAATESAREEASEGAPEDTGGAPSPPPAERASTTPARERSSASGDDSDEIKLPKNFIHSSTVISNSQCKIICQNPHAENSQSADVINILQQIYKAYSDKDFDYIGQHLDEDCTTFYEGDMKVIHGKKAALEDIKEWTEREAQKSDAPLLEITLDHPYCNVNDDHAVVTFTAIKQIGGLHPGRLKSHVNDIFKKNGDSWVLFTHFRSNWKELN